MFSWLTCSFHGFAQETDRDDGRYRKGGYSVGGSGLFRGLVRPYKRTVVVHEGWIPEVLAQAMRGATGEIQWILDTLPEKQQEEIAYSDGVLTGGCALLRGMDRLMSQELALNIKAATDPMSCTILGLEAIMNDLRSLTLSGRRFAR